MCQAACPNVVPFSHITETIKLWVLYWCIYMKVSAMQWTFSRSNYEIFSFLVGQVKVQSDACSRAWRTMPPMRSLGLCGTPNHRRLWAGCLTCIRWVYGTLTLWTWWKSRLLLIYKKNIRTWYIMIVRLNSKDDDMKHFCYLFSFAEYFRIISKMQT